MREKMRTRASPPSPPPPGLARPRLPLSLAGAIISVVAVVVVVLVSAHLSVGEAALVGDYADHLAAPARDDTSLRPTVELTGDASQPASPRPVTRLTDDSDYPHPSRAQAPGGMRPRELRDTPLTDRLVAGAGAQLANGSAPSDAFEILLRKKPYSRYWSVEQKWDDLFKRFKAVQGSFKQMAVKSFMRDLEYYADLAISGPCERDLKFIQNYAGRSSNVRWLFHMFDATGKNEPGMLTGNLAHLGHVVQCIRARAPARPSNDTFDERFFEQQTRQLGERFRGKYCLASIRPVLPEKPRLVSRFSRLLDTQLLSNISYTGEPVESLKRRAKQMSVDSWVASQVRRSAAAVGAARGGHSPARLDQVPFESELYQYLIEQRNFMFTLPRFMGVCYPSSCSRDDIRASLQKTFDEQHQVVDLEFDCELEEASAWHWFRTPRLVAYVFLALVAAVSVGSSLARYVLVDKLRLDRGQLKAGSGMERLLAALELLSMDKCAGVLFIKTRRASSLVDWTKVENNRSSSIDALRGALILLLVYSQLAMLGCLPVPFMWSKWADAMFPFYRSFATQLVMNAMIWTEAFYTISGYLIALKLLENHRPSALVGNCAAPPPTNLVASLLRRYVRLTMPMVAMILLNYVWPRLSNGFVMQDQAEKILGPCDSFAWTNLLMFHNYHHLNETCLWPTHVSASFFQLHLLGYPIVLVYLYSLRARFQPAVQHHQHHHHQLLAGKLAGHSQGQAGVLRSNMLGALAFGAILLLALFGALYPALRAYQQDLVVPFLIDYIDYDNYQRVLEWMVLPTQNHLTSYVIGLGLAFLVVRRRVELEQRRASSSDWPSSHYAIHREGSSFGSLESRAPHLGGPQQQQQQQHQPELPSPVFNSIHRHQNIKNQHVGKLSIYAATHRAAAGQPDCHDDQTTTMDRAASVEHDATTSGWFWSCCASCLALVALVATLSASWWWNGLGRPMSGAQTFAYVALTRPGFSLAFAYLFYRHFAERKNSNVPWMVTRFLVPVGRMSLMVFYMSWLVIWFDLLSSLYQWHPSHYFLAEKYNEIIFMTLVLAIFAYGAFEGTIKRLQYAARLARSKADQEQQQEQHKQLSGLPMSTIADHASQQRRHHQTGQQQVKRFESFFQPVEKKTSLSEGNNRLPPLRPLPAVGGGGGGGGKSSTTTTTIDNNNADQQQPPAISVFNQSSPSDQLATTKRLTDDRPATGATAGAGAGTGATRTTTTTAGDYLTTGYPTSRHLSPADQCRLNAELRANYSFASIGLYESVGATGELTELSSNSGSAGDPQVTPPPPSSSHRHA